MPPKRRSDAVMTQRKRRAIASITQTSASNIIPPPIPNIATNQPLPGDQSTQNSPDTIAQRALDREAEEEELLSILEDCLNANNTKKAYRGHQERFMKWCAASGRDITVSAG